MVVYLKTLPIKSQELEQVVVSVQKASYRAQQVREEIPRSGCASMSARSYLDAPSRPKIEVPAARAHEMQNSAHCERSSGVASSELCAAQRSANLAGTWRTTVPSPRTNVACITPRAIACSRSGEG
jgi:hypothetical protein